MTVVDTLNLLGGAFELAGAGFLVARSFAARSRIKELRLTYDQFGDVIQELKTNTERQVSDMTVGFALLALGLVLQLYEPIARLMS